MFSMHDFIMKGLLDAVGKWADYQVILNSAGWNQKGVLTEEDLAIIDDTISKKNVPPAEVIPEDKPTAPVPPTEMEMPNEVAE